MVNIACNFSQDGSVLILTLPALQWERYIRTDVELKTHKSLVCLGKKILLNAEDTCWVCADCFTSVAGSVSSSRGTSSDTDSQHWTSAEGKLLFLPPSPTPPPPPPLLLPSFVPFLFCLYRSHPLLSFHPATFIILSSLDHSSPPLSMPLFSLYLSLALTSLQHCSVGEDASTHFLSFVFPTCKVFNLNPTASSSHGRKNLFFIIIIITWHR